MDETKRRQMLLSSGKRLGSYEILATIGVGGMGEVYKARDTRLDRIVAIKVLPEHIAGNPELRNRFEREAKTISSLNHPHICTLYDVGSEGGVEFLVMEYLEGETAAQRLAKGPIPLQQVLRYGVEIAEALDRAHRQGITHRDLKPGNVMLTKAGAKLLDFGLAKLKPVALERESRDVPTAAADLTGSGTILGTLQYMAPEQVEGASVDQRADIFAFGAILYEMATGKKAFDGRSQASLIGAILRDDPQPISALQPLSPAALDALVATCLAKDPDDRWQSAGDVGRQLRLMQGSGSQPRVTSLGDAPMPRQPALRKSLPILAALVLGAAVAAVVVWLALRPPPAEPPRVSRFFVNPPASAPLANIPGYDLAISPDGKRLAYLSATAEDPRASVYVRELDDLELRAVAATGLSASGGGNTGVFFSTDGRSIGFRALGQGIMRTTIDGGSRTLIAADPMRFFGATWLADGSVIFSSGAGLFRVPANGGGMPERLTTETPTDGEGFYVDPVGLPGEHAVLFVWRGINATENIKALDLSTGEERIVVEAAQSPSYSPTGHLVFSRGDQLLAAPFDLRTLAVTREPVVVLEGVRRLSATTSADYALAMNGTLIYVPGRVELTVQGALVWVDRSGAVTGRAVSELVDNPRDPRLSPDGARLLLTAGVTTEGDLWVYDLGGRPPIPLIEDGDNRYGIWSPDGNRVAFVRRLGATAYSLYTMPSDGSSRSPEVVPSGGVAPGPSAWTSDDEIVLFRASTNDITAIRLGDTAEAREIVATPDTEAYPSLSPDGRWLAYMSTRTGRPEIWAKRYPDGVPIRISSNGGVEPVWSRNGRELFYRQGNALMAVSLEGDGVFGAAAQLFDRPYFQSPGVTARSYDVAPDGRFLMIQVAEGNQTRPLAGIVVVENWTAELERLVPVQ